MQKRKCILKNSVSGAICELEFDLDKSLINNIRVWCHTYGEQMRHFIPEKYYDAIMKDSVPAEMKITSQICFGKQFVHISENVVLRSQVGKLAEREDIPEIRLNIDDYVLSKNELDVYKETEESFDDSKRAQLIVVYQEIDGIPCETMRNTSDRGYPADKADGKDLLNDAEPQERGKRKTSSEQKKVKNISKDKNTSKKKTKVVLILLGLAVLGAAGGYGAFTIVNNPVKNWNEMMIAKNYKEAVSLYNEKISGEEKIEEKVDAVLDSCMDKLMETYTNDNSTHDAVVNDLTIFADIKNEEFSRQAKEYLSQIQFNEEVNAIYQDAEEKYNAGDYLNAMSVYLSISEEMKVYELAQEKYKACRDMLLEAVVDPQTPEDFESYIKIVEGYLQVVEDEEFLNYKTILLDNYAILMRNTARSEALANAETAFSQGNYSNVFAILNQGLTELPGDIVLEDKIKEYQTKYVDIIKSQADAQVQSKNYGQALNIVNLGISVYDCEEFRAMLANIEQLKASDLGTYNAPAVNFLTYEDSIENEDQINEYEFTAANTGRYGISASGLANGFKTIVKVYSVKTGTELGSYRGMTNTTYFYIDLEANEKYKLSVEQYTGTGNYQLKVGQPKAITDVGAVNKVNDSIEYENQMNKYTFTPEYTGNYRLDFANIKSGFTINVYVYDSLGYEVNRYRGLSNGRGLTLELNGGETYRIEVNWNNGTGDYEMSIGRQKYISTVSLGTLNNDTIQFTDQTNYYTFTPTETGKYSLNYSEMESGFTVNVYVFDELGYEAARYRGLSNGRTLTFDANAGEQYKIRVSYNANMGNYKFVLSPYTEE